jgi:hypothetical protein
MIKQFTNERNLELHLKLLVRIFSRVLFNILLLSVFFRKHCSKLPHLTFTNTANMPAFYIKRQRGATILTDYH